MVDLYIYSYNDGEYITQGVYLTDRCLRVCVFWIFLFNGSISEIATKKSEFHETLSNGGINAVVNIISEKLKF